jgi:predicted Zn-dependent peptidase
VVLAAIVGATGIGWAWSHTVETPDEPAEGVVTAQPPDSTGFAPLPTPLPEDPAAATIHRLDNGLTYLVAEDHASPLVSAQVCVRRHIPPDNPLLSPWFTYAMTRGTERAGTTDFAAEKPFIAAQWAGVDKLATQTDPRARARTLAEIDAAFVSAARFEVVDETKDLLAEITNGGWRMSASPHAWCHQTSLPAGRLSVWLVWMSDLVQNLALRSPLQILRDTIQIHLDLDPEEFITRQLGGSAPADAAAIEALLSTSEHAFRQYTRQVTVPGNVMFSFAGNIDPASVRALLDAELGGWASGPTLAPPGLGASRTGLEELTAGKLNQAGLGWRTPALGEPGFAAARLLLGLLLALAEDDVRDGQSFDVSGSFDDRGMLLLWTKSDRGSPEAQEQLLRALLDRIARGAFEDSIWLGVRRRAASEPMTDGNGPVTNPVQTLAERAFVFGVPWASMVALPADYASTPREDVESLARALAASEPARVHVRPDPSPAVTDALGDAPTVEPSEGHSPLYEELINRPYTPPEPKFLVEGRDFVVDRLEDRTVIASQIPGSSYALTLRVEQGELTIPGICDAVDRLAGPDTGETSDTWAATGARVDWRCGDRSVILTLRGPNESFVATLDLWSRWLAAPSFRTQGSSLPSTSMAATDALQRYLLFGRPTVLAADEADAAALWRSMWAAPSWVLYEGPDADSLSALQLPPITGNRPEHTTVPLDLAQNVVLVEMANVTRPVIGLGIVGPRVHTKDRELWRLYQYMDHITRPDYTVVIVNFDEAEGRHLELGGGEFRPFTSAVFETPYENAIDGLRWGLQVASWERTVSEASLAGAKTQVENELRHDFISRSDVPGRVYGFVSRGSSSDPRLETWQRLPSIALDEVRRFADAMEDTEPAIGIIVSPGLVDERALREFGPVQHLGLEQLFVTRGASGEP